MTGAGALPLSRDADFRRYAISRIVSVAGSGVTYVVLPVLVYRLTGSPLLTGAVTACEALPYLLLGLVAGVVGDRYDRRRLMVAADVLAAVIVGSVPLAAGLGRVTVAHALLAAAAAASVFVFFDAANFGALPTLVVRDRVAAGNAVVWTGHNLADVVVPIAAGAALAVASPAALMSVDAVSFGLSAVLVSRIRRPMSEGHRRQRATVGADVRAGLAFLWQHRPVRAMTVAGTAQSFAGGAFVGQLVVYADHAFHAGSGVRLGLLYGAWGIGSSASGVVFGRLERQYGCVRLGLAAMPLSAILAAAVALAPTYPAAVILVGGWAAVYMLIVMAAITYRQQVTPEHLLSRVNTTGRMLSWGLGSTGGAAITGALASVLGVRAALICASITLAVGAATALTLAATGIAAETSNPAV